MGLVFSKRWVSFHKTTRIFFEGGHTPLFLCLSDSVFLFVFFFFSWFCLVVVVLCVLLLLISIGGMAIWIRFPKCRLQCLFFISLYNPQNDGVGFFKTMGFISQNDAYIF